MTISIDAEKEFDKIQHPFIIKTLKLAIGSYLNIIKTRYDKPTTNIFNEEKLKSFFLRNKTRVSTLITPVPYSWNL